jgi:hypothetical protein
MVAEGILYVVFNESIRNPKTNEIFYKIGITKNSVHDRYYGLGLKMPGKFETLFAYRFEDYAKVESLIHGIFSKFRENGEWFNLNQKQLDLIKANCEEMGGILENNEFEKEIELSPEINTISPNIDINPYKNDKISKINDKCIIIKIHQETVNKRGSIYEAVRQCWNNNKTKAEQVDYVLAVVNGIVKGVFKPTKWYYPYLKESCSNCSHNNEKCKRIAFIGEEVNDSVKSKYLGKYIPDQFMRPGPGPFLYT